MSDDRHVFTVTRSTWTSKVIVAVTLASVVSLPLSVFAKGSGDPKEPSPAAASQLAKAESTADTRQRVIEELNFPGGTAKQYVEAVEAAIKPRPLNVIFSGDSSQVAVRGIRLRQVSVDTAMRVLHGPLTDEKVWVNFTLDDAAGNTGVYVIASQPRDQDARPSNFMSTRTYSLRACTVADSPEDEPRAESMRKVALSAIEQGLSFAGEAMPAPYVRPTVRYHPESGLMFVRASDRDQSVAESIVKQLDDSFRGEINRSKKDAEQRAMALKFVSMRQELDDAKSRLAFLDANPSIEERVLVRPELIERVVAAAKAAIAAEATADAKPLDFFVFDSGVRIQGDTRRVRAAKAAVLAAAAALGQPTP